VRVLVFARAPVAGAAKTRLMPALGGEGAAHLHRRLVRRALGMATGAGIGPVELWCAPDARHPFFAACRQDFGCTLHAQASGDLGARMRQALETGGVAGGAVGLPALVLGSDAPGLQAGTLQAAGRALHTGRDCVLVPALDGGYVLIGLAVSAPALFEAMPWGTETVLEQTRRRCRQQGLDLAEWPPVPDIDVPEDLVHCPPELWRDLRIDASAE